MRVADAAETASADRPATGVANRGLRAGAAGSR